VLLKVKLDSRGEGIMVWSTAKGDLELRAEGEEGHGRQRLDKEPRLSDWTRLNLRFFDSLVPSIVRRKNQVNLMFALQRQFRPALHRGLRPLPYPNPEA
jgi:hypothetical protein